MPPGMGMGMGMGMNLNDAMDLNKDVEFISEQQSIEVYPLNYSLSIYFQRDCQCPWWPKAFTVSLEVLL